MKLNWIDKVMIGFGFTIVIAIVVMYVAAVSAQPVGRWSVIFFDNNGQVLRTWWTIQEPRVQGNTLFFRDGPRTIRLSGTWLVEHKSADVEAADGKDGH